jgi:hypothetical protein
MITYVTDFEVKTSLGTPHYSRAVLFVTRHVSRSEVKGPFELVRGRQI